MMRALISLVVAWSSALSAQGRWKQIGTTVVGNPVFVDPKSIKRENGIITATLRAQFVKPVKVVNGTLTSSRTVAMINCEKRTIAVKENTYYFDEARNQIYEHRVPKIPGFASIIKGALPDVAATALCAAK